MSKDRKTVRLVGVDLGQQRDYTAINVMERVPVKIGVMATGEVWDQRQGGYTTRYGEKMALGYRVRRLERPHLGTPYTDVVARVVELVKKLGGNPVLTVDATGVGRPVIDMLWKTLGEKLEGTSIYVDRCAVTITGGDSVTRNPDGGLRVPKRFLISATLVLLQNGRLKIADALP